MDFALLKNTQGKIQYIILFVITAMALFLVGGLSSKHKPYISQNQSTTTVSAGACCDSGDGNDCHPQTGSGQTLTFEGKEYGLLKTKIKFTEGVFHLKDSGEKTSGGDPIIINNSENYNSVRHRTDAPQCTGGDTLMAKGLLAGTGYPNCIVTPKGQIIYVCKKNCVTSTNPLCSYFASQGLTCYGDSDSEYDVYFRLSDYPNPGIPNPIKNCEKQVTTQPGVLNRQQIIEPSGIDRKNLHLTTFRVINPSPIEGATTWLSPWCKPAIYLYPQEKTAVNVQIKPQGKLTFTIPLYPENGWNVTAYPSGTIDYHNATYDYLYYEAEIPNESYKKPETGFVIKQTDLKNKLNELLKKLGLSDHEKEGFVTYWTGVLPKSEYYFVGVIPQQELNMIAPLSIFPKPSQVIRVTLYFEALDQPISVTEPTITTPARSGFTVVEWGGIFKRDKNHPFSCFM